MLSFIIQNGRFPIFLRAKNFYRSRIQIFRRGFMIYMTYKITSCEEKEEKTTNNDLIFIKIRTSDSQIFERFSFDPFVEKIISLFDLCFDPSNFLLVLLKN